MYQVIASVLSVAIILLSFWSPLIAWIAVAGVLLYVGIVSWALSKVRYNHISDLSECANALIQKHGHIYKWRFAAVDLSLACGPISVASLLVGIVSGFKGFYFGIAFGIIGIFAFSIMARYLNPIRFLKPSRPEDAVLLCAHEEIVEFLTTENKDAGGKSQ